MSYAISYGTPHIYRSGGKQTQIHNQTWVDEVKKTFTYESNQRKTIGVLTVDQLYESKKYHCCHDLAHIFASVVCTLKYPCVLVETTSIAWSKKYAKAVTLWKEEDCGYPQGHNLVEVYLNKNLMAFFAKGRECWQYGIDNLHTLIKMQKEIVLKFFKTPT